MKIIASLDDFQQSVKTGAVLVDMYADWCGPCRILTPVLEDLADENPEVTFVKVNIDDLPTLAQEYGVMSIPTLLYLKDGILKEKTVGVQPKAAIQSRLDALL